jgi:hypothetical protein
VSDAECRTCWKLQQLLFESFQIPAPVLINRVLKRLHRHEIVDSVIHGKDRVVDPANNIKIARGGARRLMDYRSETCRRVPPGSYHRSTSRGRLSRPRIKGFRLARLQERWHHRPISTCAINRDSEPQKHICSSPSSFVAASQRHSEAAILN